MNKAMDLRATAMQKAANDRVEAEEKKTKAVADYAERLQKVLANSMECCADLQNSVGIYRDEAHPDAKGIPVKPRIKVNWGILNERPPEPMSKLPGY